MVENQRIVFADTIRGLAVLLMIQVHIMELFASQEIYESLRGGISLFFGGIPAAPIFMLMMGYFLAFSKKKTSEMAIRAVRLFIGGIMLNIGLNLHLLYNIFFKSWELNPLNYIFGADIFTLAGLSLLFFAIIKKIASDSYYMYFGLAIVIAIVSQFFYPNQFEDHSLNYVFSFFVGGTSWSFFPLIPWLSYSLVGFGFKLLTDKIDLVDIVTKSWSKYVIGFLILLLSFSINFAINITTNLPDYYHFDIMFFLWSLMFIMVWIYLLFFIEKWFYNTNFIHYLQFLGKNVTVVYVIQWLIIGNLGTLFYKSANYIQCVLWFLLITISSSTLTNFWVKFRIFNAKKKHI